MSESLSQWRALWYVLPLAGWVCFYFVFSHFSFILWVFWAAFVPLYHISAASTETNKGRSVPPGLELQMVLSLLVDPRNQTHDLWKSSWCQSLLGQLSSSCLVYI